MILCYHVRVTTVYFIGSAILAHFLLKEKLGKLGILGCVLCMVGSTIIVLHAPGEHDISSVGQIWELATQPSECMLLYMLFEMDTAMFMKYVPCFSAQLFFCT